MKTSLISPRHYGNIKVHLVLLVLNASLHSPNQFRSKQTSQTDSFNPFIKLFRVNSIDKQPS